MNELLNRSNLICGNWYIIVVPAASERISALVCLSLGSIVAAREGEISD